VPLIKKRPDNKSGYIGVSWDKSTQKWVAQIGYQGSRIYLGLYDTPEKAKEVYTAKQKELHLAYCEEDRM